MDVGSAAWPLPDIVLQGQAVVKHGETVKPPHSIPNTIMDINGINTYKHVETLSMALPHPCCAQLTCSAEVSLG